MSLSSRDEALVHLTVAIVLGDWEQLARLRRETPPAEVDRGWREAVLQTHLFAGFPRMVAALEVLEQAGGLGSLEADELESAPEAPAEAQRAQRGAQLFERIYGPAADTVRDRLEVLHADFARWIAEHAYARVLSRPGLAADRRELLAVAALIVTQQDRQLASHARGAVRCGATPEELLALLALIGAPLDADWRERAREILSRFGRAPG